MTPAFQLWKAFTRDPYFVRFPSAYRVFAEIIDDEGRIITEPRPVKVDVTAHLLGANRSTVMKMLDLLVERGYLINCGRRSSRKNAVRMMQVNPERLQP